ncbi:MAG: putative DNA binding domain-containing protein [Bacteroidia bacterium]
MAENQEDQSTEWKEAWQDEYLKWICGFANSQGGRMFIGKDDKGNVKPLANSKKLLEDLPNKVRDTLGILVDVHLHTHPSGDFIEIVVEPYPYPINVRGRYYYRTGSTNQELKGAALDRFLLQKQGRKWDGVPMPDVTIGELDGASIDYFRRNASKSQRGQTDILQESTQSLLEKLHLIDGKLLKRAAILLFHANPEKYITGCYIKIGYFQSDEVLVFQDTVHGSLFEQVEKALELLLTKYLRANIKYQGLVRIEEYPIPIAALREALLNALAHKAYESGIPIQISVYNDHLDFWNSGQLPDNLTLDNLQEKHPSDSLQS